MHRQATIRETYRPYPHPLPIPPNRRESVETKVKRRSTLHLIGGAKIGLPYTISEALGMMAGAQAGGIVGLTSITGHGTTKQVLVPVSAVVYFEEA